MINRINYEEFFLLYVDGELSHQQREAVDLFVLQNPDMAAEFEILIETKLGTETGIIFPNKTTLLKTELTSISSDNCEAFFLLYADNELADDEKTEVEKFVLQHPRFQQEFTLLMQTVLQPEDILFADKKSLYKKETAYRFLPLFLSRIAVAAAFIGLIALVWWLASAPKNSDEMAVNSKIKKVESLAKLDDNKPAIGFLQQKDNSVTKENYLAKNQLAIETDKTKRTKNLGQQPVLKNPATYIIPDKNQKQVPIPNDALTKNETEVIIPAPDPQDAISLDLKLEGVKNEFVANEDNTNKNIIQPAVYKLLNIDNQDNTLYIGTLELNKEKVRGFLKKAGHIFSRKNNNSTDNGKLQVANLEINTH